MPKKQKTNPIPTPAKKLEVFALKRKSVTPEQDVEVANDAPSTPAELPSPPVVLEPPPTPGAEVESPDSQPVTEIQALTPGAEVESPDAQPITETLTPTLEAEVKPDAPAPTRPVLRKKSERPADGESSSDAPTTPGLLEAPPDGAIFQAVGVIVGEVTFDDEGKATVAIGEKTFPLYYAPQKKKAMEALRLELKSTGVSRQRLLVYPRIIHFPKREQPHHVSFQLVAFRRSGIEPDPNDALAKLDAMEFKLSGLWQFIPVCATPCVTILKNYTEDRKDFIKEADLTLKVKFMKASHIPVVWRDAPVRPFRFNPKAPKENQGNPAFVQLKTTFAPETELFQVCALTSTPAVKAPRFLKARKEDKLACASAKLKALKGGRRDKVKPQGVKKIGIEATPNAKPTNDSQRGIDQR